MTRALIQRSFLTCLPNILAGKLSPFLPEVALDAATEAAIARQLFIDPPVLVIRVAVLRLVVIHKASRCRALTPANRPGILMPGQPPVRCRPRQSARACG